MKTLRRCAYSAIIILSANLLPLLSVLGLRFAFAPSRLQQGCLAIFCTLALLWIVCRPQSKTRPDKRLRALSNGCELLRLFLCSATVTSLLQVYFTYRAYLLLLPWSGFGLGSGVICAYWLFGLLGAILCESVIFWAGMLRVYATSVQLGIKHRVMAAVCSWIPVFNICYLLKLIRLSEAEVELETEKITINAKRAETGLCKTRYPLLLVHGVFFRDFRYLNYWGRIPSELQKNGAVIFYGEQESAASVEVCGEQLAARIRKITEETGCEKVNIIAHSKGGLDSRAAISRFGAAPLVASLTTINTPHRGCIFAEYLLGIAPESLRRSVAKTYNTALKKLGDRSPDFLAAIKDLTETACLKRSELNPDPPGILCESVMSCCKKAKSGRFPLNLSYPIVKHFDGKNDGLVSLESAKWGERFTLCETGGARGISHGDMIDLNRENIPDFDVREFYVALVSDLKRRGC
ncbi:MAG: triacylglycerol lipase [Oscillospiraceae bacterium]